MQTGHYVGSGVYGSDNKNSLTFNFVPKIVIVMRQTLTVLGVESTFIYIGQPGSESNKLFMLHDKTLSWYNTDSAAAQCNSSSGVYYYIALG